MAKRPPQKGSVEWHKLPSAPAGYEGVEIGVRYVGAHQAGEWQLRGHKMSMDESARRIASGGSEDSKSVEFVAELRSLCRDILSACIAGARPVDGMSEDDASGALELLEFMGEEVETKAAHLAKSQQSITLRQQFHSEISSE